MASLCWVGLHVMLLSAYLWLFDKQHTQDEGAVKCHGNNP